MTLKELFNISSWWGKIAGFFFGYIAMGPVGALLGLIVGNLFDKGLINHYANPHFLYHAEKQKRTQRLFFEATFASMGRIAKADGRVSEQELEMARHIMREMRLNKQQQKLAKRLFNEGKNLNFRLDLRLQELKSICHDKRELLRVFIDIQYRAAQVDGLSAQKIMVLNMVFATLGFAPLDQQHRFYEGFSSNTSSNDEEPAPRYYSYYQKTNPNTSRPFTSLEQAYTLLGVHASANKNEVKKAYRTLLSKNHPDKLIAQGLPESMIKLANEKTHRIRASYELICQNKGWK